MNSTAVDEHVIAVLAAERHPRSHGWLRQHTRLPSAQISDALLRLQKQKRVRRVGGQWEAIGAVTRAEKGDGPIGPPTNIRRPPSDERPPRKEGHRAPTGAQWDDFRRLCLYYAECVRLDERPRITAWQHDRGKSWAPLSASLNWRALSGQESFAIARNEELTTLVRAASGAKGLGSFVVGLAVDLFETGKARDSGEPLRGLTPLLLVRSWAELDRDRIVIHPTGLPELNHQWLESKVRGREKQWQFLDALGLMPTTAMPFDEDEPATEAFVTPSVEQTLERLFEQTKSKWIERGDLANIQTDPPLEAVRQAGIYNRVILSVVPDLKFAKRLARELEQIATEATDDDLNRTALRLLFPASSPTEGRKSAETPPPFAEPILLNGDQRAAVEAALSDELVVVTGPPGTGKSTVVQTALINQALRGRGGLLASRNHQGLEAVEPRINALVDPDRAMLRPVYPFSDQARRFEWQRLMVSLLGRPSRAGVVEERKEQLDAIDRLLKEQRSDESKIAATLDLRDQLSLGNEACHEAREKLPPPFASMTPATVAAAPVASLARLAQRSARVAGWSGWLRPARLVVQRRIRRRLKRLAQASNDGAVKDLLQESLATSTDRLAASLAPWIQVAEIERAEARVAAVETALRQQIPLAELQAQVDERCQKLQSEVHAGLKLVAESAGAGIDPELRERLAALRAGFINHGDSLSDSDPFRAEVSKAFGRAMPALLQHFPLWAVSNLSVSKAMPLSPAVFDLVVIDEASQCDLPSVVPLLYRSRRAMIVGDPMQLQHVTQLSREGDLHVRQRFQVSDLQFEAWSYRANSLFDLASSRAAATRIELRSHYRCHPAIADYCNDRFYRKSLWIRTSDQALRQRLAGVTLPLGCTWSHVSGEVCSASRGCFSPTEIEAVVTELQDLAATGFPGTVGVVTPFRAHADRIRDKLTATFDTVQLERWNFLVDTADGFQGDERDLMLFSLVGGHGMPTGSLNFLASNENRFNVAASRARAILRVIGNADWAGSCGITYIEDLLRRCQADDAPQAAVRKDLIGPVWEPRFAEALRSEGLPVQQQYPAGGFFLDIALLRDGRRIDVEVDGERYHRDLVTGHRRIDDIYRDTVLQALGWSVLRFWVYELREDFNGCVQRVCREFNDESEGRS